MPLTIPALPAAADDLLIQALDLTCEPDGYPQLVGLQNAYFEAKGEFNNLERAYELVTRDMVRRIDAERKKRADRAESWRRS